jgi:hypothetical protein
MSYSSTLKMEATCSSETLVALQLTIWRYIPEEGIIKNILNSYLRVDEPKKFAQAAKTGDFVSWKCLVRNLDETVTILNEFLASFLLPSI